MVVGVRGSGGYHTSSRLDDSTREHSRVYEIWVPVSEPRWGCGQVGQGGEEWGSNHQADLIDKVTVTLVYTEDLETVTSILSTDVPALSDSVVRK